MWTFLWISSSLCKTFTHSFLPWPKENMGIAAFIEQQKQQHFYPCFSLVIFRMLVMHKMDELGEDSFRDMSELHQASQFLHENGVLLHYDDVSLQDIYFLDPQWLCDVLANVVTIREINSLARRGNSSILYT